MFMHSTKKTGNVLGTWGIAVVYQVNSKKEFLPRHNIHFFSSMYEIFTKTVIFWVIKQISINLKNLNHTKVILYNGIKLEKDKKRKIFRKMPSIQN